MASQFDSIRNRTRQGEEAKQRVLDRVYSPSTEEQESSTSVFDVIRNRSLETDMSESAVPMLDIKPSDLNPLNSSLTRGVLGDKVAQKTWEQNSGMEFKPVQGPPVPPQLSEYEKGLQEIEAKRPDGFWGGVYDFTVSPFAKANNWIWYGNTPGQFTTRAVGAGGSMILGTPSARQATTGNPVADKAADITGTIGGVAGLAFNPAAAGVKGQGLISGPLEVARKVMGTNAGQKVQRAASGAINSAAPRMSVATADRLARTGMEGAITGGIGGVAAGLVQGQDSGGEIVRNAALGVGLGAVGDMAIGSLSSLFKRNGIPEKEVAEILALPEPRSQTRMREAEARSQNTYGADPIVNPYSFDLPEASPGLRSQMANAQTGRAEIKQINQTLNELESQYEQRVIEEYKYLKESRDSRKGVEQGSLHRDAAGDVVGRTGRMSNNPLWYQEFYKANGKVPSNKDLYQLARDRVDNGFQDESGFVPSWKQEFGYNEQLQAYQGVKDNLQSSLREIDPALNVTDGPIVAERLKDLRREGTPTKPKRAVQEPAPSGGKGIIDTSDIPEFLLRRQAAKRPTVPAEPTPVKVDPNADPILRPSQFEENSGLGISAFAKTKPYESLSNDTRSQLVTRLDREPVNLAGAADRLYTNLVDDLHPLNQFDKLVEDVLEKPLSAAESIHKRALATRGSDMTARQIVTDALVDSDGKVVGESLKEILSGLPKTVRGGVNSSTKSQIRKVSSDIYVDFEDYLINKHAVTRADRGEVVFDQKLNWTPEYGAQKAAEYEAMFPEFKETAEKLYAFNKQMVNSWLVDTGIISPEQAKAWFDANPFYVPNKRYFTPLEKRSGGTGRAKKGFGNQSNPVKKYEKAGSQRKIISPIESIIENVDSFVKTAKRNQVMQQAVKHIEKDPKAFADYLEIVKQPERVDDLTKLSLDGDGLDEVLARFSDDFDKAMRKTALDKDNIVRVLIDGEQTHLKVNDPQLLEAITALGPKAGNLVMDAIGWVTNKMKTLTTGANPVFSITRNLFRDIPHAYVASKTTNNPLRFVADMADAAFQIMRDGELYKQYKRIGGGHSSSIAANRNLLAQSKRSVLPKSLLKDLGPRLFYGLENAMNAVESAPRLAEFKRASKSGLSDDLRSALFEAQDLTVNFKRRGKMIHELDKIFPYMNAAIQGLDQFVRLYKNNPKKAVTKAFLALTVPGAVMYAVNHDDPNYQKVSNRVKDNFLLIPKGDGTFFRIAKPMELGTLFIDLPERLMQKFAKDDPAAFRDFAEQLRTRFVPPGISGALKEPSLDGLLTGVLGDTILGPIADLSSNTTFSGAPIVPGYLNNLSPGLQADTKTTDIARWIGDKTYGTPFEQSPKKLDYLVKQYTGVLGQLGQPLLSPGGDVGSTLTQQITADPVFSNDISTEFYRYKEKLDQAYTDRDLREVPEWYSDPLRKEMGRLSKSMSEVRKEIRAVQEDKSLGNKAKRDKLRELQEKINALAEIGNEFARGKVPYK
ncbi:LPD38 domain-containing protein [Paenibacillus solani]|uniref:LPD38 domain-containing protein n=1 Tax=Paenibacillus solani TaxID=1705565 RepID=UPI003D2A21B2